MESISNFLEKFKKFGKPDILVREKTAEIIKKEIGIDIDNKKIKLREGVIYIETHDHLLKSEVFLKKRKILTFIQDLFKDKNIRDIK